MKMKKILVAIAIVAVAGINVYNSVKDNSAQLSDLQMENVEMLAEAESGSGLGTYTCKFVWSQGICKWSDGPYSVCYIWDC